MTADLSPLTRSAGWFSSIREHGDVVISTRVRLARNLADYRYSGAAEDEIGEAADFNAAVSDITDVVRAELMPDVFGAESLEIDLPGLDRYARGLLEERRLIDEPYPRRLFVSQDEDTVIGIGGQDHLRLSVLRPGIEAIAALAAARLIDKKLEKHLNYAVSLDLGYLNASILNLGTALRASILLHLPALVQLGRVEEIQSAVVETDFALSPDEQLTANEGESAVFRLSNRRTIGLEEDALAAKLEDHARALVHYERRARKELLDKRGPELSDEAYRALGVLRHARKLASDETLALLSSVRLAIVGEMLGGVAAETATALFFLSRENHIRAVMHQEVEADDGEENIQRVRAAVVREALAG
jgi:protein arginine kinase